MIMIMTMTGITRTEESFLVAAIETTIPALCAIQ